MNDRRPGTGRWRRCWFFAFAALALPLMHVPAASTQERAFPSPAELRQLHAEGLASQPFAGSLSSTLNQFARNYGLATRRAGETADGRALWTYVTGDGPTAVVVWSDMVGADSTLTLALLDVVLFLGEPHPLARHLRDRLTIVTLPALIRANGSSRTGWNPQSVALNMDGLDLLTPEMRAFSAVVDSIQPDAMIGLDGWALAAGEDLRLGVPVLDESDPVGAPGVARAVTLTERVTALLTGMEVRTNGIPSSAPDRSSAHLLAARGLPTLLIDAGARDGVSDARADAFLGLLAALHAIAESTAEPASVPVAPPMATDVGLAFSRPAGADLVIRNARIAAGSAAIVRGDIALARGGPDGSRARVLAIAADLSDLPSGETFDAAGRVVHLRMGGPVGAEEVDLAPIEWLDVRRSSWSFSTRHWYLADNGLRPWSEYERDRSTFFISAETAGQFFCRGGAHEMGRAMSGLEWGDDLDIAYPSVDDRCGVTFGLGYRWRGQYQLQLQATTGSSGTARGVNIPTASLIVFNQSARSAALLAGRRFGRFDGWVGIAAMYGSYDWSRPESAGEPERTSFVLPGGILEGAVRPFRLGPRAEIALTARYEYYPELEVAGYSPAISGTVFPETRMSLSTARLGVRLSVLP